MVWTQQILMEMKGLGYLWKVKNISNGFPNIEGMVDDLAVRGKTIQTQQDADAMLRRWVKLATHRELDVARDSEVARRGGLALWWIWAC